MLFYGAGPEWILKWLLIFNEGEIKEKYAVSILQKII